MKKSLSLIKISIFLILGLLLLFQSTKGKGIDLHSIRHFVSNNNLSYWYLIFTILLMPLNWWLESLKWQKLMAPHQQINTGMAIRTILAGITSGILTPARIGEYAGRLITSRNDQKPLVISATLLGSIAQNLCNIIAGLIFSYCFLKSTFNVTYKDHFTFSIIITIQLIIFIGMYYNLSKVAHFIERLIGTKLIGKYSAKLKSLDLYNTKLLNIVLIISACRYFVYFIQYFFMLRFFGVSEDLNILSGNIAGIYLIQTGIPLPGFMSLFARGEIAVLVWSGLGIEAITALSATFGLWFINLIIPAVLGLFIWINIDLRTYFNKK